MATGGSSLCKILRFVLLRGSRIIFLCVDVLSLIYNVFVSPDAFLGDILVFAVW